jgi:hypothetical protein
MFLIVRRNIFSTYLIYGSIALVDLGRFLSFLIITKSTRDQPVVRLLPTHRTTETQHKRTQYRYMPPVGFELTNPVFEMAKTVHALHPGANCDRHTFSVHCYQL